jgi:hypothetical protein
MLIDNPRRWRFEHQVELLIALLIGAAIGVGIGFIYFQLSDPVGLSFSLWLERHSQEAMTWAVGGAIVIGVPVYFRRLIKLSK